MTAKKSSHIAKIRQPYGLTIARQDLNKHELRILIRILEALQPQMTENLKLDMFSQTLEINLDTINLLPVGSKNYRYVKEALQTMRNKSIEVRGEDKDGKYTRYTGLILASSIYDNNHKVQITIDKDLFPAYLELKNGFSSYNPETAFNLSTVYAMRLYQLVSHWKDIPFITRSIEEIREWLGVKADYQAGLIQRDILTPAGLELKKNADLYFTFKPVFKGQKAIAYTIFIHHKSADVAKANQAKNLLKTHFNFNETHFKEIENLLNNAETVFALIHFIIKLSNQVQDEKSSKVKGKGIVNIAEYTLQSIKNHFKNGSPEVDNL